MMTRAQKRTRMSPEARREQLLDTARTMIVTEGLQPFTMEALARAASVSSPLVYKYFESRLALLCELLDREYQAMSQEIVTNLREAASFESVVRVFVQANFDHHAPGRVLPILLSQPEVAKTIQAEQKKEQRRTGQFLVRSVKKEYALERSQAELLLRMSSGASIGAAAYGARRSADRDATVEAAVRFILAGIRSSMRRE
ncbi:MAG: TetR/AcrR family transcriptional regulator [Myxococcota bacterium]|nr:TetR/AcrR family transcriptional regulator [Myxococcota bacterium]